LLETLDPKARDALRRVLIHDPGRPRRGLLATAPLPRRARRGWADVIDVLTMQPEARRKVVRLLGELSAER